jgi:hypothetical protein
MLVLFNFQRTWWSWTGSNRRPQACKARALPAELQPRLKICVVGLGRFELPTSRLSGVRSHQLSYRPSEPLGQLNALSTHQKLTKSILSKQNSRQKQTTNDLLRNMAVAIYILFRKEVIQPQVPLRLPCYDFTPVANHSLVPCLHCWLAQALLEQLTPMV